jgi:hypothetical protein
MQNSMSGRDRTAYGLISGAFGCLLGLGAALCAFFAFNHSPIGWMVLVSGAYFSVVGALRGPDAGFVVADALSIVAGVGAAETGVVPGAGSDSLQPSSHQPSSRQSPATLAGWALIMAVMAWKT